MVKKQHLLGWPKLRKISRVLEVFFFAREDSGPFSGIVIPSPPKNRNAGVVANNNLSHFCLFQRKQVSKHQSAQSLFFISCLRKHEIETDPQKIQQFLEKERAELKCLERQALINSLYSSENQLLQQSHQNPDMN
jgi:hypothetical protein